MTSTAALELRDIHVRRDGTVILGSVDLRVGTDERWVILGPNGCGKTTLMRIMALYDHPTRGTVEVLGERLGTTDVRELRTKVGYAAASLADELRRELPAIDVVKTARFGALETWWHRYTDADADRARTCLATMGVERLAERRFGSLSSGEQQRVLLARTLMNDPAIVLLDEPSARLDLGGREQLVATLSEFAESSTAPPFAMVTHHVDEIPRGVTHLALMRAGAVMAAGPIEATLRADALSECFGLPLHVERRTDGRWSAWAPR